MVRMLVLHGILHRFIIRGFLAFHRDYVNKFFNYSNSNLNSIARMNAAMPHSASSGTTIGVGDGGAVTTTEAALAKDTSGSEE